LQNISENILDQISEGVIICDSSGKIKFTNSALNKYFEYDSFELIDSDVNELFVLNQGSTNRFSRFEEIKNNFFIKRMLGIKKNQQQISLEIRVKPIDQKEQENFILLLITDITSKLFYEEMLFDLTQSLEVKVEERTEELQKSEKLYQSIARNYPSGVISILDRNFNYLFIEGQHMKVQDKEGELIGKPFTRGFDVRKKKYVEDYLAKGFQGNQVTFEIKQNEDTFLVNIVPLGEEEEKIDRIIVFENNITVQKQVELRLKKNLEKEMELNELKSRFVSMASHEFRTPLTTINSSAELIDLYVDKKAVDQIKKHTDRIKNSIQNLNLILNDFLSLDKLESGNIQPNMGEVDLHELLHEVIEEMGVNLKKNQVIELFLEQKIILHTDKNLVKNILINLLSNAIKYSFENTQITVTLEIQDSTIQISVRDQGLGIPKNEQNKMFERFFRSKNVFNIEGTGLGLTIVKRYLDILQGTISFESEEGQGTVFFITLPK